MAVERFCALAKGAVLLVMTTSLSACTTGSQGHPGNRYLVSGSTNEFYKYGPAQAFGPDVNLPKGLKVTMLDRQFGYSHIQLDDGQTGYIATDDLKSAPPEPKATPAPSRVARNRSSHIPTPPERGLDMSDVPAPPLPD